MTPLLEVCVDDRAGFLAAIQGGADRIELCSALDVGGLTPTRELMAFAARTAPIPVYAMIRPRAGDFVFGELETARMRRDIDAVRAAGLAGVVLGASRPDGRLDVGGLAALVAASSGLGRTLHRAFDVVPDPAEALDAAIALGFERILTSGGRERAPDGLDGIAAALARAAGRIVVMPGAGITAETVGPILALGPREVHASCRVSPGTAPDARRVTSAEAVRRLKARLAAGYSPLER